MGVSKMGWVNWVADRAPYFFWGIWGAGAGAFGLVLSKAVDMSGATAPVYLGFLTVAMSAVAALGTSRAMDNLADRRKIRRKLYSVKRRVADVLYELEQVQATIDGVTATRLVADDGSNLSFEEASTLVIRIGRLNRRISEIPNFDELVETEVDSDMEGICRANFIHCADIYVLRDGEGATMQDRQRIAVPFIRAAKPARGPASPHENLTVVLRYINARLRE